jgi:hypothetical protein
MLDHSAASVYSLSYIYTMDPKLLGSVTNTVKSKGNHWEPTRFHVGHVQKEGTAVRKLISDFPEVGQGRKRNHYVYGEMNPLFQDLLKLAETDQEEFKYILQGMKDLLAQSLQRQAIKKAKSSK